MLNLAMAFGQDIARSAIELGATRTSASNAIWVLAVAFGAIANAGYCIWLLIRNRTGRLLMAPRSVRYWALGILMGALWFGGVTIYGSGAAALGSWGAILGWPCLMAIMIVTANVLGWITGEWRGAPVKAQRTMLAALAVLGVGVCVIGYSGAVAP
jgi:L-rhamnose-H+ transport protein